MRVPALVKPYPWKCAHCGQRTVSPRVAPYSTVLEHDGRKYTVSLPALELPTCSACGEMIRDDAANDRITAALRQTVGLLSPEQIRLNRESLELTQKQFAKLLGIAEATVSRWETGGQIQQRSLDRLMRLFFALPEVREKLRALDEEGDDSPTGQGSHKPEMQGVRAALQKALSSCQDALRLADAG